jgi:hypothetical protein
MSVTADATVRSEEKVKVTRSRRNVAWTGLGALVVVVVLALFPYIVYSAGTPAWCRSASRPSSGSAPTSC